MTDLKEESGEKFPDLESFRAEWRRELGDRSGESPASDREFDPIAAPLPVADEENNVEEDIHTKAREYFLEGVRLEERGKLYDAVKFYKKAVALVPDIENETFLYTGRQACDNKNRNVEATGQNMEGVEDNHEAEHGNLVDEFSRINLDNHSLIQTESSQVGRQKNLCSTLSNNLEYIQCDP
ncbi:F-box only protein 9 [Eurytemora carolleeae]|uniref:F-box only protein 9 n=1 Tax=Eurytemora carolleeae TaxID=1294199 RepID=UPI000C761A50|nr:F-box only protein 9 [Eurytemora carolleeae]|eukprot:XP_023342186.1 F-box only protein 9-like [Eurytemora affinis]